MVNVVAKIRLLQRVPYGFHGTWFSQDEIEAQRPTEKLRSYHHADPQDWARRLEGRGCCERLSHLMVILFGRRLRRSLLAILAEFEGRGCVAYA